MPTTRRLSRAQKASDSLGNEGVDVESQRHMLLEVKKVRGIGVDVWRQIPKGLREMVP